MFAFATLKGQWVDWPGGGGGGFIRLKEDDDGSGGGRRGGHQAARHGARASDGVDGFARKAAAEPLADVSMKVAAEADATAATRAAKGSRI